VRYSDAICFFLAALARWTRYEALTLMQTGKSRLMPLVFMDKRANVLENVGQDGREHFCGTNDLTDIFIFTNSPTNAMKAGSGLPDFIATIIRAGS